MVEGDSETVMKEKCFNFKFLFINQVKKKTYVGKMTWLILTYNIYTHTFGFSICL